MTKTEVRPATASDPAEIYSIWYETETVVTARVVLADNRDDAAAGSRQHESRHVK